MAESLQSEAADRPPSTGRIESFSDGVIAILITIMVLELKLPVDLFPGGHLADILSAFWPRLIVYAMSFLMIAILLINHHMILRAALHSTTPLTRARGGGLLWRRADRDDGKLYAVASLRGHNRQQGRQAGPAASADHLQRFIF